MKVSASRCGPVQNGGQKSWQFIPHWFNSIELAPRTEPIAIQLQLLTFVLMVIWLEYFSRVELFRHKMATAIEFALIRLASSAMYNFLKCCSQPVALAERCSMSFTKFIFRFYHLFFSNWTVPVQFVRSVDGGMSHCEMAPITRPDFNRSHLLDNAQCQRSNFHADISINREWFD